MLLGYDFKEAVALLRKWLKEYKVNGLPALENEGIFERPDHRNGPMKLADILASNPGRFTGKSCSGLSKISDNVGK